MGGRTICDVAGLLVAVAVATTGCTSAGPAPSTSTTVASPSPETSSRPVPSVTPTATSMPPTPTGSTSVTASPREVALAAQFTAFIGAGAPGDCDDSSWEAPIDALPYLGLPRYRIDAVLGAVEPLCLVGFDLAREIGLGLVAPDGSLRTLTVVLTGSGRPVDLLDGPDEVVGYGVELSTVTEGSVDWWIRPDAPAGEYRFVAVQDPLVTSASVWVAPGTEPRLHPLPTDDLDKRRFAASGFPPGPTAFGVYRDTMVPGEEGDGGTIFELVADLGVIDLDASGAAVLDVPVNRLEVGEWYCVDSPSLAHRCAGGDGYVDAEYVPYG